MMVQECCWRTVSFVVKEGAHADVTERAAFGSEVRERARE